MYSNIGRECTLLSLLVPLLDPGVGADGPEVLVEELARLVFLALNTTHYKTVWSWRKRLKSFICYMPSKKIKSKNIPSASGIDGSQHSFANSSWSGSGWGSGGRREWFASEDSQRARPFYSRRMQETLKMFVGIKPNMSSGIFKL